MKFHLLFLLLSQSFFTWTSGQVKQGVVIYDKITKSKSRLYLNGQPTTQQNRSDVESFELSFTDTISVWESLLDIRKASGSGDDLVPVSVSVADIRTSSGDNVVYSDHKTGLTFTKRELRGKNYIVQDSIQIPKWKLTGEVKKILDFTVQKATCQRILKIPVTIMENGKFKKLQQVDTTKMIAWFTKDIPISSGPEVSGLPGLILESEYADGSVMYKAVEYKKKVNLKKLTKPKGGKVVSMEEFQSEVEKSLK